MQKKYLKIGLISSIVVILVSCVCIGAKCIKDKKEANENIQEEMNIIDQEDENIVQAGEIKDEDKVKVLDNSGYLSLEDDPNAEDAEYVSNNTEGLLKGTKTYPVRDDGKKVVYLTFDDGPSTENTQDVLDTLDKYEVKATFFVLGKSIEQNNESRVLLKRIANDGHAIANHTYTHDYKKLYPNRTIDATAFMDDLEQNNQAMKSVLGNDFSTRVLRFPGGYWSWEGRSGIRPILDENGYKILDWNTLNEDAEGSYKNAEQLVERTKSNISNLGQNADSIVFLMHDTYGKQETVKALPQIIEYFKEMGFEFKTIK